VFLDNNLNLRRFTDHATHFFKLTLGDAEPPLSDIVSDVDYVRLKKGAKKVLKQADSN
jgi:hypothetical protein